MNIEKSLEKDGIIVTEKLDKGIVLKIANNISKKIVNNLPNLNLNENEIFTKLFSLNMYKAHMPESLAEASYSYKTSSIYFNSNIPNEDLEEFAIHECLHYLQEIKNSNGQIKKMGLSTFSLFASTGTGLNEAAVQYISAKIIGIKPDFEKYYDINLYTPSPSYYPVECALLNELIFFIGEETLFKSTYFSTDSFKNKIISLTSREVFEQIQLDFDNILKYEEEIIKLNNKISYIENENTITKLQENIFKLRKNINSTFFHTQNLIIERFFNSLFNKISNLEELENFRRKITDFSQFIGITDNYTFFDNYYQETMNRLEHKCNVLENGEIDTAISKKEVSFLFKILEKLKGLFYLKKFN